MDELSQPVNTVERILEKATTLLLDHTCTGVEGGVASEEEAGSEDEDEEFDDYYNDDQDLHQDLDQEDKKADNDAERSVLSWEIHSTTLLWA